MNLSIEADGHAMATASSPPERGWRRVAVTAEGEAPPSTLALEAWGPFGFGLVRTSPTAPPLPRDRALP